MLGMSQIELCQAAAISRATLIDLENNTGDPRRSSYASVERAFFNYGVIFMEKDDCIGLLVPKRPKKLRRAGE
jgi:transcriptional regulator with XRE-family HTH domain